MKNIFIMFSILILTFSCTDFHEKLTKKESNIINTCINYIEKFIKEDCYIIDPYFNYFSLSNYSNEINEILLEKLSIPEADLKEIESSINKDFFQKYNRDLKNLSTCNESSYIMGFSGIGNDMIIGYFSRNIGKVKNTMLTRDYELNESEINYFIFLLDKGGNIKEVIKDGVIFN
ncbi:hypothetical protein KORDIASMS9_04022 [Kordia sp. SMS9]|uniref:hypothetical protein n=1 Tax=Kordia sp. SMS9 TaxID=2282170 RepID=UPI000E0D58E4|nr:hypothetical protein [Kordia sp. SMS9]AXG71764.1 hypothetical protein KORDIASMS9_04022 [Kordia sp. SMS9]